MRTTDTLTTARAPSTCARHGANILKAAALGLHINQGRGDSGILCPDDYGTYKISRCLFRRRAFAHMPLKCAYLYANNRVSWLTCRNGNRMWDARARKFVRKPGSWQV